MRAKGINVSANGKHHIVTNREPVVTEGLAEKDTALCGGLCAPSYLEVEGSRLADALDRGELCETCLDELKERNATIPGFIVNGELVGTAEE